jgi:outer membrane protein assembly factor BamB
VPVVVNGVVFAVIVNKSLYALDALSGAQKWVYNTNDVLRFNPCAINSNDKAYHTSESGEQN